MENQQKLKRKSRNLKIMILVPPHHLKHHPHIIDLLFNKKFKNIYNTSTHI